MSINTLCTVLCYASLHSTLFPSKAHILKHENGLQFLLFIDLFRHNLFPLSSGGLHVMCNFSFLFVVFSPFMCWHGIKFEKIYKSLAVVYVYHRQLLNFFPVHMNTSQNPSHPASTARHLPLIAPCFTSQLLLSLQDN